MSFKEFFKPTIWKIVITLILVIFPLFYFICEGGPCPTGFPFEFGHLPGSSPNIYGSGTNSWNFQIVSFWGLIGNIIIWYFVVCILILIYHNLLSKKQTKKKLKKK